VEDIMSHSPAPLLYDEAASRKIETINSTTDVKAQRAAVLAMLALQPGKHVLDVGCGPGFLAADMLPEVAPGGTVVGVDISASMLAMARDRLARAVIDGRASFVEGDATALPFDSNQFDAVASTQVIEYLDEPAAGIAEIYRVLRPGGRVVLLDTDWSTMLWHSTDDARMRRVLAAWDEHCPHKHLPRILVPMLRAAGFEVAQQQALAFFNPSLSEDAYSHGAIELIGSYVPGKLGVTADEAAQWAAELRLLGAQDQYFFTITRFVFLAVKPN
jgi:ubiquinone/menaquinone biosynthesis C-methylase UbiE